MKEVIEMRIPPYISLVKANINNLEQLLERFMYLIDNKVVLHNDQLDKDFILLNVEIAEGIFSQEYKVRITIDILDDIDKDILNKIETLKHSLGELLPTKRAEKFGAKE